MPPVRAGARVRIGNGESGFVESPIWCLPGRVEETGQNPSDCTIS